MRIALIAVLTLGLTGCPGKAKPKTPGVFFPVPDDQYTMRCKGEHNAEYDPKAQHFRCKNGIVADVKGYGVKQDDAAGR